MQLRTFTFFFLLTICFSACKKFDNEAEHPEIYPEIFPENLTKAPLEANDKLKIVSLAIDNKRIVSTTHQLVPIKGFAYDAEGTFGEFPILNTEYAKAMVNEELEFTIPQNPKPGFYKLLSTARDNDGNLTDSTFAYHSNLFISNSLYPRIAIISPDTFLVNQKLSDAIKAQIQIEYSAENKLTNASYRLVYKNTEIDNGIIPVDTTKLTLSYNYSKTVTMKPEFVFGESMILTISATNKLNKKVSRAIAFRLTQ